VDRQLSDGLVVSTDPARLDVALVHRWLSDESYWAAGRPRHVVERSLEGSLVLGVYDGSRQVGFGRAVTDAATFAWLCDVYVDEEYRGRGVGGALVETAVSILQDLGVPRIVLATRDAHEVYERAGFTPLAAPQRWMEIDRRPGAVAGGA